MNNYQKMKSHYKSLAIEWQTKQSNVSLSYLTIIAIENYFYRVGKRYGLVKEFKNNGII